MATYTYTVLYQGAEIATSEGMSFEWAREEALSDVSSMYPRDELEFVATCDTGVVRHISGPCYL
jgi:hypothetical protein